MKSLDCVSDLLMGFKNTNNIFKEIDKPPDGSPGPFVFTT